MDKDYLEYLKSLGISVARGVPQLATGFVDLAALPFTLTGLLKPEQAVGSTDWMTAKGYLPPKQEGLLSETTELLSGAVNPAGAIKGGLLGAGIIAPQVAKKIKTAINLPSDDVFLSAVRNTPGAEVVDDGLKISLMRNQKPEQAGMESVRGGVFYLPEGSGNAKHYATGVSGYGGKEPISGETVVKNPLFVKGATGGKAPAAAYDSLMGKGAYEKMRADVLQATGVRSLPGNLLSNEEKAAHLGETLQKYGVDPSVAGYILENSKYGNQLPYAMQEYIVSEAARKAGHDSIVGFSKKKTGEPFISEVFDLREATYPTTQGGYSLRKEFLDEDLLK